MPLTSVSTLQTFQSMERDHMHVTLITVSCYNRSVLLVIVTNLLLCLNGYVCMYRKMHTMYRTWYYSWFQHPWGSWNIPPPPRPPWIKRRRLELLPILGSAVLLQRPVCAEATDDHRTASSPLPATTAV